MWNRGNKEIIDVKENIKINNEIQIVLFQQRISNRIGSSMRKCILHSWKSLDERREDKKHEKTMY